MNKWSRLNTTMKLAFGMSDAGNIIEPIVNTFSPVANLTSQAVDVVGDYLPQSLVQEANSATKSLGEDISAGKANTLVNSLSDSDFYKNYSTATTDPVLNKKLDRYGLSLSKRPDASPLRKALNSVRAERHFSSDKDDIWRGVLPGGDAIEDPKHIESIRRNTALAYNKGRPYDIGSHAASDLFGIPNRGYIDYPNTAEVKGSAKEYSDSVLAPYLSSGSIPLTDTIDDLKGINNPEFSNMNRVSETSMPNSQLRDYANELKNTYGEDMALDIINSQISGDGVPDILDYKLPRKR